MEVKNGTIEKISFFKDEKFNEIYQEYYKLNKHVKAEEMREFVENIDTHLHNDFLIIKMYNESKEREFFKLQMQRILFSLFGIRKKSFDKYIENGFKIEKLTNEMAIYFENFALDLDEVENSLINSFKIYYDIVLWRSGYNIEEVYTTYKTMLVSIIHMLPQTYREDLFETNYFRSLKNDLLCLECYDDFTTSFQMAFDIKKFDTILKEHLSARFGVDLYDYSLNKERKLV